LRGVGLCGVGDSESHGVEEGKETRANEEDNAQAQVDRGLALENSDQSEEEHTEHCYHLEVLAAFRRALVKLVVSPRFEEEVPERSHDLHVSRSLVAITGEGVRAIKH